MPDLSGIERSEIIFHPSNPFFLFHLSGREELKKGNFLGGGALGIAGSEKDDLIATNARPVNPSRKALSVC